MACVGRMVRDHSTGEVHVRHEPVAIRGVTKNLVARCLSSSGRPAASRFYLQDFRRPKPRIQAACQFCGWRRRVRTRVSVSEARKQAFASEPYSPLRITERRLLMTSARRGGVHCAIRVEQMCITQGLAQCNQVTTYERGLLQSAHRQCLSCDSLANDLRTAIESDLALANGHLVTPVHVKSLPGAKRRKTAKPARIAAQTKLGTGTGGLDCGFISWCIGRYNSDIPGDEALYRLTTYFSVSFRQRCMKFS
jgi:hypothetical protein